MARTALAVVGSVIGGLTGFLVGGYVGGRPERVFYEGEDAGLTGALVGGIAGAIVGVRLANRACDDPDDDRLRRHLRQQLAGRVEIPESATSQERCQMPVMSGARLGLPPPRPHQMDVATDFDRRLVSHRKRWCEARVAIPDLHLMGIDCGSLFHDVEGRAWSAVTGTLPNRSQTLEPGQAARAGSLIARSVIRRRSASIPRSVLRLGAADPA